MKQFDIQNFTSYTTDQANLFDVYTDVDGNYYFNILKNLNFVNQDSIAPSYYTTYQVLDGDTWTIIAHKFYTDYRLWWLICKFNNIINPLDTPAVGTYLKIPTAEVKNSILSQIKSA